MMGGQSSKSRSKNRDPSPSEGSTDFEVDLGSYEAACKQDPQLKSFDSTVHQRTNRAISSLATSAEFKSLTFDSLREVTGCLFDMNQDVVNMILESKEDVWNNRDLSSLVHLYFQSSIKTLDFCACLENCVKRARVNETIIRFAVNVFEREAESQEGVAEKIFEKTLEELKRFRATEEPFSAEFFELFTSVYQEQMALLKELHKQKQRLDRKLKAVKTWRRVLNAVFVTAFVSVLIFSVVAAAIAAPPIVTALAGALVIPVGSVGKWCSYLWKKYENEVKDQKEIVVLTMISTRATLRDMDTIRALVDKLNIKLESLQQTADFALQEQSEVRVVIEDIKKNLDAFTEMLEEVGRHAANCHRSITMARTTILQRIIRYPSGSTTEDAVWQNMVTM